MTAPIVLGFSGTECTHWLDGGYCRAVVGLRVFRSGVRCPVHTPAALAGEPEPDELLDLARQIRAGLAEVGA